MFLQQASYTPSFGGLGLMPNHVHAIVTIVGAGLALPSGEGMTGTERGAASGEEGAASSPPTLPDVVRAFKSISAIGVNRLLSRSGQPSWQRNYYEHVIRNDEELERVRRYVLDNPLKWGLDREPSSRHLGRRRGVDEVMPHSDCSTEVIDT